jgi:hypothetical protein
MHEEVRRDFHYHQRLSTKLLLISDGDSKLRFLLTVYFILNIVS